MSYLKDRTVGLLNYATDYDNHLPLAHRWQSAVVPYVKENAHACLELDRRSAPETGLGMDSRLSGIALEKLGHKTDNASSFLKRQTLSETPTIPE